MDMHLATSKHGGTLTRASLRHAGRAAGVIALALGALLATAPSSPADDVPTDGSDVEAARTIDNIIPTSHYDTPCRKGILCQTDNAQLTYYMDSGGSNALESDDKATVRSVLSHEYGSTDLSVSYDSTPSWSGDSETDIYYSEGTVSGSDNGYTYCENAAPGMYKCDQQYVKIEPGHWSSGLVCHETGHAVGFVHGEDASPVVGMQDSRLGCMKKNVGSEGLGDNNRRNINSVY